MKIEPFMHIFFSSAIWRFAFNMPRLWDNFWLRNKLRFRKKVFHNIFKKSLVIHVSTCTHWYIFPSIRLILIRIRILISITVKWGIYNPCGLVRLIKIFWAIIHLFRKYTSHIGLIFILENEFKYTIISRTFQDFISCIWHLKMERTSYHSCSFS